MGILGGMVLTAQLGLPSSEVYVISGRNWRGPAGLRISISTVRPLDFL